MALDTGSSMSRFSGDDFVTNGVSQVTDLQDSDLPVSSIVVVDSHNSFNLAWSSSSEIGRLDSAWDHVLKLEGLEDVPCLANRNWKDSALRLVATDWN